MSAREARRHIDGFIWEMIMGNQNPIYELYNEPTAPNESGQDFDDPLLP